MIIIKICFVWLVCSFLVQAQEKNYSLKEFCSYVDDAGIYDYSKNIKSWKLRHTLKGNPVKSIKRKHAGNAEPKRGGPLDTVIYFSVNRNGKGLLAKSWRTRLFFHRFATTDSITLEVKKLPDWFQEKLNLRGNINLINVRLRKGGLSQKNNIHRQTN